MSLYGMLRTGVSGMNAQSTKLSTVGDNIANADTTGYKRASTEFSSLLMQNSKTSYNSGSVVTNVRYAINQEGPRIYTTSPTDLAINGSGFFVVQDPSGQPFMTRAGGFQVDGATGLLKNQAGFTLMGYDVSGGQNPNAVLNGFANMVPVDLTAMNMQATPTTEGTFTANLDARKPSLASLIGNLSGGEPIMAGVTASANSAASTYNSTTSVTIEDNLGNPITLDIYFNKLGPNTWEMTTFNDADGTAGGFPYTRADKLAPGDPDHLDNVILSFDPVTGDLNSPDFIGFEFYNAGAVEQVVEFDITGITQTADPTTALSAEINGNLPSNNAINSAYTTKSSIETYDNLGGTVLVDVYMTKVTEEQWEITTFNKADADPVTGGFPYSTDPLATQTVTFDATTGELTGDIDPNTGLTSPATTMTLPIPGGQPMTLDIADLTQLKSDYTPLEADVNGNAASTVSDVEIGADGTVQAVYDNGSKIPVYRIPLADVPSPDKLEQMAGNVFQTTLNSGDIMVGFPTEGSNGEIISGALEQSNVDLATEFTEMIVAQRSYTSNSKVFQTGNELLEVLMNLKR
ncbi:flagellar hook-basal body complex protein [Amorphus orientalis]|uniref:Flagellar hook protein FlgE n=1 Tax=Amorphus orientalis TaxID=649198 RepID=A0AAE3VSX2_9HYPH|nr:flagellar hook-basal body complex protein [Amorphus orientalis]MDQ0317762.1 flagellar hook protein FlgE [Amorphus orientalis]